MKQKLSFKEYIYVASMLFGMFFGAGNLIFPVYMGQVAGRNMWAAVLGFLITGVGLPLLGVAALGISRSNGLFDLSHKVGRPYAFFFTCALYLTIGPFFAIPRCATTSFTVGLEQILPHDDKSWLYLLLFSLLFFAVTLVLSLRPGKILTYVGKVLTPCFLVFLAIMVFVTILHPTTSIGAVEPQGAYAAQPFFTGFLEGYNTMDALASLAFGIVVVQVIQGLGVEKAESVAMTTVRSGILSCLLMGVIYLLVTLMGVWSRGALEAAPNGGTALAQIAQHYLGKAGLLVLAANAGLPENGGGPYHQLRGDLRGDVPQGPVLPELGVRVHGHFLPAGQRGPDRHYHLRCAGADVPVSSGHHPDPAGAAGPLL